MGTTQKNNLETFRILHLVTAVLYVLGAIFMMTFFLFFFNIFGKMAGHQPEVPAEMFSMFNGIFIVIGLSILIIAILNFLTAKYLKEGKNKTFIIITSVINCFSGILGILLGVFTIIEVNKDYAMQLFDESEV